MSALFGQGKKYRRGSRVAIAPIGGLKFVGYPLRGGPHRALCQGLQHIIMVFKVGGRLKGSSTQELVPNK
jgi:hypothetical protein